MTNARKLGHNWLSGWREQDVMPNFPQARRKSVIEASFGRVVPMTAVISWSFVLGRSRFCRQWQLVNAGRIIAQWFCEFCCVGKLKAVAVSHGEVTLRHLVGQWIHWEESVPYCVEGSHCPHHMPVGKWLSWFLFDDEVRWPGLRSHDQMLALHAPFVHPAAEDRTRQNKGEYHQQLGQIWQEMIYIWLICIFKCTGLR